MSAATGRQHAAIARLLIKACGGLDESARACRLSASQLGRAQDGLDPAVLPIDVVADLELYCGKAIYSRALVDLLEAASACRLTGDLVSESCDVAEAGADLQALVRKASKDGKLSAIERRAIGEGAARVRQELADIELLIARASNG
jgi:hypothetical protein